MRLRGDACTEPYHQVHHNMNGARRARCGGITLYRSITTVCSPLKHTEAGFSSYGRCPGSQSDGAERTAAPM